MRARVDRELVRIAVGVALWLLLAAWAVLSLAVEMAKGS